MPCQYHTPAEEAENTRKILNQLTRHLCWMCNHFDQNDEFESAPVGLKNWWIKHQQDDAARVERQRKDIQRKKLVQSAASKLTADEKRALGLPG